MDRDPGVAAGTDAVADADADADGEAFVFVGADVAADVPATGSRSPGSSAPAGRLAGPTGRTASSRTPPGASGTAPWPRLLWKEGFQ